MFQRAFRIFTSGLLEKVGLARDKAVVAGGAVAACLHPWPSDILALWEEEVASTALIRSGLGKLLPPEIALAIDRSAEWTAAKKLELDRKLFEHLCGKTSAYSSSDIDIFFVCPTGSVDVNSACQTLPMVHKSILRNREAVDLRRILNKNDHKGHWVFTELNDWGDWFRVKVYGSKTPEGLRGKSSREYEREREKTDDDGWSPVMEESMRSRFKLLWTVRTTNSITVTGLHPVRHTQLMLPVVRAAEQVIYPFDLDCVAVFYDGSRVYASPRSLRAFNTRANFADLRSIQDRARALRMVKYGNRGFATVAFEICRHHPRCDVIVAANVRDMLARAFPKSVTAGGRKPVDPDNDEAYPVRFDPDDGNADLEPPLKSIGMDYTPAPLLFGPYIGASELHEQITTFARGWYPINGDENRYFTPLVKKMPHSLTKDAAVFSSTLLESDGSFIPMQFKFVKDDWLARRIRFATALHLCYICKKDTGNSMEIEANDDQSPEDQEGPSPMNFDENSDEDASQEKTSPKSTARRIALCKSCAELNARKRAQSIDLSGKVAIVTGGRIKIGRQVVLKLLRMGAEVHTTTRFPLLLLANLKAEPDSEKWWSRLKVYGLDLSEIPAILALCSYWSRNLPKLDMLIQNAAQTIRRPSEYYEPMVRAEAELTRTMDSKTMAALAFPDGQDGVGVPTIVGGDRPLVPLTQIEPKWISDVARRLSIEPNSSLSSSALRSLITFDDAESFDASVPRSTSLGAAPTVFDPLGPEPTDTRTVTTWTQSISTVPTSEMAIVTLVNCLSPAILLQKLQGLLSSRRKPSGDSSPSFVVNVSSREGSFAPSGQDGMSGGDFGGGDTGGVHPHTNMAKAGLNRLTQSVAGDLATEGIHVVAVDPGWVSVMGPETGVRDETTRGSGRGIVKDSIVPPLTDEDGAARVLDPVIQGLRDGVFFRGVLLRNFVVSTW
ncbi:hypothetical protein DFJ73DRAFT_833009 [Zopfochytrium polystomum]|nr:hypothetical protein DFJ73DRAFT_833009 [Zopfochytrium polystomum]